MFCRFIFAAAVAKQQTAAHPSSSRTRALEEQVADLTVSVRILFVTGRAHLIFAQVEGLEKERDFYFGKLRDIEILMQRYDGPDKALAEEVLKIL